MADAGWSRRGHRPFFFARWRAAKPAEPLKTRLVDFTIVQFAAIVALLVMVVHLMSLGSGQRFKGRFGAVVPVAIEEDRA